jgi:hypothetical protein
MENPGYLGASSASRIYFESSITDRLQLSVIYTILSLISLPKIREHMVK